MKKEEIIKLLIDYVKQQEIKKGKKLPSERELSSILNTSRASIREAVSILKERKILTVKMGSGIYLAKSIEMIESLSKLKDLDESAKIKNHFEACFAFVPLIIGIAASRADKENIEELQKCIVKMSRAIVLKEIEVLIEADCEFYQILAVITENYNFLSIIEQLLPANRIFWEYFLKNDMFDNNVIFAGYIEIVNAVNQKDSKNAIKKATKNIENFCRLYSEIKGTDYCTEMPDVFKK